MAQIHKISGYIVDPHNVVHAECLLEEAVKYEGGFFQHLHVSTEQMDDWDYNHPLKRKNCDLAYCEQYFKKVPTGTTNERKVILDGTYRHFKTGKLVRVLAVSQDTESPGTYYVVYQCPDGSIWNRPYNMFLSEVDHKKYPDAAQKYRFELVSPEVMP